MAVADVFYLPSYREGFRLMLIEAEAVGLLNVASKIYGTASFLLMCFNPRIVPVVLIRLAERCHRHGASPLAKGGESL